MFQRLRQGFPVALCCATGDETPGYENRQGEQGDGVGSAQPRGGEQQDGASGESRGQRPDDALRGHLRRQSAAGAQWLMQDEEGRPRDGTQQDEVSQLGCQRQPVDGVRKRSCEARRSPPADSR